MLSYDSGLKYTFQKDIDLVLNIHVLISTLERYLYNKGYVANPTYYMLDQQSLIYSKRYDNFLVKVSIEEGKEGLIKDPRSGLYVKASVDEKLFSNSIDNLIRTIRFQYDLSAETINAKTKIYDKYIKKYLIPGLGFCGFKNKGFSILAPITKYPFTELVLDITSIDIDKYSINGVDRDKVEDIKMKLEVISFLKKRFNLTGKEDIRGKDANSVISDFGLEPSQVYSRKFIYDGVWEEVKEKYNVKSFIYDLKNDVVGEELSSLIIFGSLAVGNYFSPTNINRLERLEKRISDPLDKFIYYTVLMDLFNYPYGSDIDLCFIVNDFDDSLVTRIKNYLKDIEYSKESKFKIDPKYHFEHFSIIKKRDFIELLSKAHSFWTKNDNVVDIDIVADKIDIGEIYNDKISSLLDKINSFDDSFFSKYSYKKILEKLKEYSINRLNSTSSLVTLSSKDVFYSLHSSFVVSFDEEINKKINSINLMYNLAPEKVVNASKSIKELVDEYMISRVINDIVNQDRLDKFHFLKLFRYPILNYYKEKYDPSKPL